MNRIKQIIEKNSVKLVAGGFIVVMIGVLAVSDMCKGASKVILSGTIETTQMEVRSEVSGKIISKAITEGDAVQPGELIALVDPEYSRLAVDMQNAIVRAKEARLEELEEGFQIEEIRLAEAGLQIAQENTVFKVKLSLPANSDMLKPGMNVEVIIQI